VETVKPYSSMMSCVYQQWGDLVVHCGRNSGLERDSARVHVSNQWVDMFLAIIPQNHSSPPHLVVDSLPPSCVNRCVMVDDNQ
jgi:hypothetical protein